MPFNSRTDPFNSRTSQSLPLPPLLDHPLVGCLRLPSTPDPLATSIVTGSDGLHLNSDGLHPSVHTTRLGKAVLKNLLLGIIAAEFRIARDRMKQVRRDEAWGRGEGLARSVKQVAVVG